MCGWYWLMLVDVGWLVVGTGWVMDWLLLVITCYYLLLLVITCYYLLLLVITCYYLLLLVITCWYFDAVTVVFT